MSEVISHAGVVITNREHGMLLLHRADSKMELWEMPGGRHDDGETFEETALRTAIEQLGTEIEIIGQLGCAEYRAHHKRHRFHWHAAQIIGAQAPEPKLPHHDELAYFDVCKLSRLVLSDNMQQLYAAIQHENIIL